MAPRTVLVADAGEVGDDRVTRQAELPDDDVRGVARRDARHHGRQQAAGDTEHFPQKGLSQEQV